MQHDVEDLAVVRCREPSTGAIHTTRGIAIPTWGNGVPLPSALCHRTSVRFTNDPLTLR
jgi:hypothetical protein